MVAAPDDGRRRGAAEECARFGSGRDKWRESWESRENMVCIRADEVSNSDRQAWGSTVVPRRRFWSKLAELVSLLFEMCKQGGCGSGGVQAVNPVRGRHFSLRKAAGPRPASNVQGKVKGGPVTTRGGAADGSCYGVGRERSINAGHHSADLGTTTLLARTELCKQPHPGLAILSGHGRDISLTKFEDVERPQPDPLLDQSTPSSLTMVRLLPIPPPTPELSPRGYLPVCKPYATSRY